MPIALVVDPVLRLEDRRRLRAGQSVRIAGQLLTARDAACRRMVEALRSGAPLPVELAGRVVYAVGPTPPRPGQVVGSAGPTTVTRLLPFLDALLGAGVAAFIGKGDLPPEGADLFRRHGAVYFAAVGGAGASLARTITSATVLAYPDLDAEAVRLLRVVEFPAVVAVDVEGRNLHATARAEWQARLRSPR